MSPEMCRDVFLAARMRPTWRSSNGQFEPAMAVDDGGGKLETLCQWLSLPRLVVLDAAKLASAGCHQSPRPRACSGPGRRRGAIGAAEHGPGVALGRAGDRGVDRAPDYRISSMRWLGRAVVARDLPRVGRPVHALLGGAAAAGSSPAAGRCRTYLAATLPGAYVLAAEPGRGHRRSLHCYFPDTLDWLELRGASVVDFFRRCGRRVCRWGQTWSISAAAIRSAMRRRSENHCMKAALWIDLRAGRRIYARAEAWPICASRPWSRWTVILNRMVGIISAAARLTHSPSPPRPMGVDAARPNWLADKGERLRGYLHSHWELDRSATCAGRSPSPATPARSSAVPGRWAAVAPQLRRPARTSSAAASSIPQLPRARFVRSLDVDGRDPAR